MLFVCLLYLLLSSVLLAQNGVIDPSFSTIFIPDNEATSLFVTSDGKILVTALDPFPDAQSSIHRYSSSGQLDVSFNGIGSVILPFNGATQAIEQPNKKILIIGATDVNGTLPQECAFIRLNPDGSPDVTFNNGQTLFVSFPSYSLSNRPLKCALQKDNAIVVVGDLQNSNPAEGAAFILRITSTGSLDASFNSSGPIPGTVVFQISIANQDVPSAGRDVVVQPDGKLVMSAFAEPNPSVFNIALVRFNSDGSFDNSFTSNGQPGVIVINQSLTNGPAFDRAVLILQPDGKYLVIGTELNGGRGEAVIFRVNQDGTLDTSFNGTGKAIVSSATDSLEGQIISLESDGSIIVNGNLLTSSATFIARIFTNGTVDTTFGSSGLTITPSPTSVFTLTLSSALQITGYTLVAVSYLTDTGFEGAVYRYIVNIPLMPTHITSTMPFAGTAQGASLVEVFSDSTLLCSDFTNAADAWSCSAQAPSGTHFMQAIAHYANGGNINIPSSFCQLAFPLSPLSNTIFNKYCSC